MNSYQRIKALEWFCFCSVNDDCDFEGLYYLDKTLYLKLWLNGGTRMLGYDISGENVFSEPYGDIVNIDEIESNSIAIDRDEIIKALDISCDIHR